MDKGTGHWTWAGGELDCELAHVVQYESLLLIINHRILFHVNLIYDFNGQTHCCLGQSGLISLLAEGGDTAGVLQFVNTVLHRGCSQKM